MKNYIKRAVGSGDLSGLRLLLILVLATFWILSVHRPHLPFLYPTYQNFQPEEVWALWGRCALVISAGMLFSRPGGVLSQVFSLAASIFFFFTAGVFTGAVGIVVANTLCTWLGLSGVAVFGADFKEWFPNSRLFKALSEAPPKWFSRRYGNHTRD